MHSRWLSKPKRDFVAPDSGRTIRSLSGQEHAFEGRCSRTDEAGFHMSVRQTGVASKCLDIADAQDRRCKLKRKESKRCLCVARRRAPMP